jgi:periplasmic protein TonB
MEPRLFEQLTLSSRDGRTRGVRSLPVSLAIHLVALAAIGVGPILVSSNLPGPIVTYTVCAAPAVLAPVPPPPRGIPPRVTGSRPTAAVAPPPETTVRLPTSWSEEPLADVSLGDALGLRECAGCVPWGSDDVPVALASAPAGPPPEPPAVRLSSGVDGPVKLHHVVPVYPELAKQARVEGIVVIECRIDTRGRVTEARVLSGHPLLDDAALDAVRQWQYRPTLLNGQPISVIMTVTVRFALARQVIRVRSPNAVPPRGAEDAAAVRPAPAPRVRDGRPGPPRGRALALLTAAASGRGGR